MAKKRFIYDLDDAVIMDNELSKLKYDFRKKGLVPIIEGDTLRIYKVKSNKKLNEIITYIEKEYKSIFENVACRTDIIFDRQEIYRREIYYREPEIDTDITTINTRLATKDEMWKILELDDEIKRNEFYLKNAMNVEAGVPINDEGEEKGYRKERIDEVVSRIAQKYEVRTCEKASKMARLLKLIISPYYNLDLIAEVICEFLGYDSAYFSTGTNVFENGEDLVRHMTFSTTENELSKEEKINCIRKILDGFDIECIVDLKIKDAPHFLFETIVQPYRMNSKETILDFAKHNSEILENKNVSEIIDCVNKDNPKKIKRK